MHARLVHPPGGRHPSAAAATAAAAKHPVAAHLRGETQRAISYDMTIKDGPFSSGLRSTKRPRPLSVWSESESNAQFTGHSEFLRR